jgi:ribosomal protein S18 acetylase RimI-like enzyme
VSNATEPRIRTAVTGDLPELQRVYRSASLSNEGDAPLLLARPEFLVFAGDGIAEGLTRAMVEATGAGDRVLGFATVVTTEHGKLDLDDLFVDPPFQRRGIARRLVLDSIRTARESGHARLFVTANPHAMDFYRSVGFVEIGRTSTELGSGSRMQLDTGLVSQSAPPS